MRILFVVHNFPPHWFAGVEIYSYHLAKALINLGINVSVLYPLHREGIPQPVVEEALYDGITVYRLISDHLSPQHANLSAQIANEGEERAFANFLERQRFNVIHFHHTLGMPFSFIKIVRQQEYPVSVTLHDFWFLCVNVHLHNAADNTLCGGPTSSDRCMNCLLTKLRLPSSPEEKENLKKWIDFRISYSMGTLRDADCVVSPSRYLADIHRRFGLSKPIEVSPLGLNAVRHSARITGSPVVFGFLGNVHDLKNVYLLAEAFKEVTGAARLLFFGTGAPLSLRKLAKAIEGDGRIEYRGGYSPSQLGGILEQVDIVVLPSITENYPLVVREALSAGIPVIASRVGGIPEIVTHLQDGILFDPTDKDELRKWMQAFADRPSLAQEMKKNIRPVKTMQQDAEEWSARYWRLGGAISILIEHPELRINISQHARTEVLSNHTLPRTGAKQCLDVYERFLRGYGNSRPADRRATLPNKCTVSIIIPLFNQVSYTRQCLEGLAQSTQGAFPHELVLVDNGSTDGTGDFLKSLGNDVRIISNPVNQGFARACNQGASVAAGKHLVFLNNDTIAQPGWLDALMNGAQRDGADICGAKLLYPDGRVQHAGIAFNERGVGYHIFKNFASDDAAVNRKRFMQCVTGACMLVSKALFQELKGFDESFINGFEDVDLCLRAGAMGKKIIYIPESVLIHFEETSEGRKTHDDRNLRLFLSRWGQKVSCDDEVFYRQEGFVKQYDANGKISIAPAALKPEEYQSMNFAHQKLVTLCDRFENNPEDRDNTMSLIIGLKGAGYVDEAERICFLHLRRHPDDAEVMKLLTTQGI